MNRPEAGSLRLRATVLFRSQFRMEAVLARFFPDPVQARQFAAALEGSLSHCPDPQMALANLSRWAAHLVSASATFTTLREDPRLLDDLLFVFAASQYLADILIREPTAYPLLMDAEESLRGDALRARIAAAAAPFARGESRLQALRRARRREMLRIGWRDLTGRSDFATVVAAISTMAEALIEQTLVAVREPLALREPEVDARVRFAVIAMGKLGGGELNYSSDVDLLFVYDSAAPDDPAALRYATKLAEALIGALTAATAEGMLFRVDMRLRPEGRYGAIVRSLASYREYYDRWIETWERQALLKARPVAGDAELGRRFAALAGERAYPSLHSMTLLEEVRDVRAAIARRVESRAQSDTNVKEGRGTIREIEFTVQLLQIMFGAGRPALRTGSTLQALAALEAERLLSADERARFEVHYRFFRTVEHRLQLMDDLPVRLLPESDSEQRKLARRLGYAPERADQFMPEYRARAAEVEQLSRGILDRLAAGEVDAGDPLRLLILALAPGSGLQAYSVSRRAYPTHSPPGPPLPDTISAARNPPEPPHAELAQRLGESGFRDVEAAVGRLRGLATGAPRFSLPLSTTRLFADLAGSLLRAAAAAPDPDGALAAVSEVADRLGTHRTLYQTLQADPDMLRVLCGVVGFSPVVRERVLRHPELLDVLYDEPSRGVTRPVGAMRSDLDARLERAFSPADRLAALRRFQQRELMRIIARDLLLNVPAETSVRELSGLADVCVASALEEARRAAGFGSESADGFAVFALGRLGGRELQYLSDLDLLYAYEAPSGDRTHRDYEALATTLTRSLQEWLPEGRLYPVDLRLRPEGKSGPLVVHLDAARRYYLGGRAQVWERLAMTRLRLVAGDPMLAARFTQIIDAFVYGAALAPEADAELRAIKQRVETERTRPEERALSLKLGPGGLSDIEFLVQRLQLAHGRSQPPLRVPDTLAALDAAAQLGLLPEPDAQDLQTGWRFLTRLRQHLHLRSTGAPTDLLPQEAAEQEILARSLALPNGPALAERFHSTTTRVRELFRRHFLSG